MSNTVTFIQTEIMDVGDKSHGTKSIKRDIVMVLILDGNSEHVALACTKIGLFGEQQPICDCSRYNQMA